MKKFILGITLYITGFIGVLTLLVSSLDHPWDYNGIQGLLGFLLGSKTLFMFIISFLLSIIGFAISIDEVYGDKIKKILKNILN